MMALIIFLWLVGLLFTCGFLSRAEEQGDIEMNITKWIGALALWPFVLGDMMYER